MESAINKFCIKLRNSFNINAIRFLKREQFSRSLYNVTKIQKPYKTFKPKLFVPGKRYEPPNSEEKISILEYSLLSIPIAAFMLGTWQVERLRWKKDLQEKLKNRTIYEPIELPANLEDLKSKEYYPIKVKGTFLYDQEFIMGYRGLIINGESGNKNTFIGTKEAQTGYHVITPFKLADRDLTILVNRGWIPKSLRNSANRQKNQVHDETEIVGILRLNERRPAFVPKNRLHNDIWYYRDLDAMAKKGNASPIYIEMISNNNFDQYPIGGQTRVKLRNEHLSYILTWYCLSAVTAYMWYRKFIKKTPFLD